MSCFFHLVSSCFTQLIGIPLVRWSGEAGGFSMQMVWKFLRAPTVISVFLSLLLVRTRTSISRAL